MPKSVKNASMRPFRKIWILSDGKAGDESQCLGVAEQLGADIEIRRIAPRAPWRWLMPFGPHDPRERRGVAGGPISGPLPDLVIASGRKTVPYLRALKRLRGTRPFTVYLKDPRTGSRAADFVWAPDHDRVSGGNVLKTVTSPHRVTPEKLRQALADVTPEIARLPRPRVAVLVGGNSRHHSFLPQDIDRLFRGLLQVCQDGASLMITTSRRTPEALRAALAVYKQHDRVFLWDGKGENPYLPVLASADAVIVTADSVNMVGEAAALGKPVHVFRPTGGHRKIDRFLERLSAAGIVCEFDGRLEIGDRPSLDSTPVIAAAILDHYDSWHAQRGKATKDLESEYELGD